MVRVRVRVSDFWGNSFIEFESNSGRNKTLSVGEYLNKMRQHLKDIINNLKKSDSWKIQLAIANNIISSIVNDEEHVMRSKSHNKEIMINDKAVDIIKELSDSPKNRYQNNLKSMKRADFVFNYVHLLSYKYYKIKPNCGGSYILSPDWIKDKNETISLSPPPKKKDKKRSQYAVTVALNHSKIKERSTRNNNN